MCAQAAARPIDQSDNSERVARQITTRKVFFLVQTCREKTNCVKPLEEVFRSNYNTTYALKMLLSKSIKWKMYLKWAYLKLL